MNFTSGNSVRLKATSELLYVVRTDDETATAFCQKFGPNGPEGHAQPFPLDLLRENVKRDRSFQRNDRRTTRLERLRCRLGLHAWTWQTRLGRPVLGRILARNCRRCGIAQIPAAPSIGR